MGSSSSGGSSSSRTKKATTAAVMGNSLLGPVGGAIAGGLSALSSRPSAGSTSSGGSSSRLSASQQQSIDALGREYNSAIARGDTAAANAFHNSANQIRSQAGLVAGMDYDAESGRSLRDTYGTNSTTTAPSSQIISQAAYPEYQQEEYDPTPYINEMKEAQRASRIASLDKAKSAALSSLDTEKANVAPTYYDKRNQAAAASDVGAMNFAQYMAARGIKGAAGAMPEVYRQAGLQGQIGALDRQEASDMAGIERQRSNVNTNYESDVTAANADVEAQALQNYITQMNADRAYQLQQAQLTGSLGDSRTLAGQEFDYSKSSSNPAVQAAILANRAQELNNAAREIENSFLPDTLKLQAQRLKQQVEAGALDADTALAQLNQIKAQTANYGRSGSSGGLTAYQQNQTSSKNATNNALLQVSSYGSKAEALAGLQAHGADMIAQGVDIQAVMDAINDRWPY